MLFHVTPDHCHLHFSATEFIVLFCVLFQLKACVLFRGGMKGWSDGRTTGMESLDSASNVEICI